jgi:hypothetical protein
MKRHAGAQVLAEGVASQPDPLARSGGTLLGWYTAGEARRYVRAVATTSEGLCVIDQGSDSALLVEPKLDGMSEARALAADYLALASERGEPQTRHPWPTDEEQQVGGRS